MRDTKSSETCSLCGGKLQEKPVRYLWEQGERLAVIEGVPARVCQQCGMRWYPASSARALERAFSGAEAPMRTLEVPIYSLQE